MLISLMSLQATIQQESGRTTQQIMSVQAWTESFEFSNAHITAQTQESPLSLIIQGYKSLSLEVEDSNEEVLV